MGKVNLSILVPTYKRLDKLKELLINLTSIDYPLNYEVLVGNDNPSDTKQIKSLVDNCNKLVNLNFSSLLGKSKAAPFRLLECKENRGLYLNRVNLIRNCDSDYFIFVDDDDFLNTGLLDKIVNVLLFRCVYFPTLTMFNLCECHSNLVQGKYYFITKFDNKEKVSIGVSGSMFNTYNIKYALDGYEEYLKTKVDLKKVVGEDQVFINYFVNISHTININLDLALYHDVLYIANYEHNEPHMMFGDDVKERTVDRVRSIKTYININDHKISYV